MNGGPGRLVLLGHPLGHSLSPRVQNAALKRAGIALHYEPLDVPRHALEATIDELRRQRAAGNVTIPYKEDVLAACDRLTDAAEAVGAVNTFWTAVDGALVGDNTDAPGFGLAAAAFLGRIPRGATVGLLGAGGGAAAVLHAMEKWEVTSVSVYSRDMKRAGRLAMRFPRMPAKLAPSANDAVRGASLVVNATPVGLSGNAMPVDVELLADDAEVMDLAYRPGKTAFVLAARARGLRAQDGLRMLVEQGALAFERWFSRPPDHEAMWDAVKELH